jgi:hypothetical protein
MVANREFACQLMDDRQLASRIETGHDVDDVA